MSAAHFMGNVPRTGVIAALLHAFLLEKDPDTPLTKEGLHRVAWRLRCSLKRGYIPEAAALLRRSADPELGITIGEPLAFIDELPRREAEYRAARTPLFRVKNPREMYESWRDDMAIGAPELAARLPAWDDLSCAPRLGTKYEVGLFCGAMAEAMEIARRKQSVE